MPEQCGVHQHNGQEHAPSLGCNEHCTRSKGHSGLHGEKQPGDDCMCLFKVGLDSRDRPEFEGWVPCPLHARAAEMRELLRRWTGIWGPEALKSNQTLAEDTRALLEATHA